MKKSLSRSHAAFFNPRVLVSFALCVGGLALAISAFKTSKISNPPAQSEESEDVTPQRHRDVPVPGEDLGDEARNLDRAEQYWNDRLTYPTGKFDPAWVRAAAVQHKNMPTSLPAGNFNKLRAAKQTMAVRGKTSQGIESITSLSTTSATSLGPSPLLMTGCANCFNYTTTQARVNAVAVDPTTTTNGSITAYAGSVGGGVWKTTNCCNTSTTWAVTTDDPLIGTTSIDTITIDPNNHNTIYAGTGDLNYGSFSMGSQGILKSTDGGNTWTTLGASVFGPEYTEPTGNYPQYNAVGKVRVDPNNSNNVAAGTKNGLYLSNDGGNTWTQCATNTFTTQRQDITGLGLSDMGGGVTRIVAAVGTRGFPTYVQYDLGNNGANGIYSATIPASGCPSFTSIASNSNGFVFGTQVTGSPYLTGANMNAGSGVPCNYPISGGNATYCGNGATGGTTTNGGTVNNLGRIDIAVAPSNPNVIYAQVGSIDWNSTSGCGNTTGCELGVWYTVNGGTTWNFMQGSAGGSLTACTGSAGGGDYPQNWYDQGIAVDPNDPTRIFVDTFDIWFATQGGTSFYDTTCGYTYSGSSTVVHVDQHALDFLPGSSSILVVGNDGGIHGTTNADTTTSSTRPTWFNLDGGMDAIEFYAGDISGNFATASSPIAVGGAQDNGSSSITFSGSPTGPVQWQMGVGGDGFVGQVDPIGTGSTQAQGTIAVSGAGTAGQQFTVSTQTFTWVTSGNSTGQVVIGTGMNPTNSAATNIVTAINRDISSTATAGSSRSNVTVTAAAGGTSGNAIPFYNGAPPPPPGNTNTSANLTFNGSGTLGGTTQGDGVGSLRLWECGDSGSLERCTSRCTSPNASWSNASGSWTSDTQSFVLPINLFRGGIPGGDDCGAAGLTTGCGHVIAGTTRVWETVNGAGATAPRGSTGWYVTNNPTTANLSKGNLGNRSYINQVKYSPKFQSVAIVGTNDGNVQIGFNLGTGTASQANWVDLTNSNAVLPDRPINGVTLDPSASAANVPVGYAAVGGFNANSLPSSSPIPGHIFQVTCQANCGSFTWVDKTGNMPDIPADCVIVNPNYPQQVFAGTDFGLYFTNDITQASPTWYRFTAGLPNVMIWDMSIDRGSTTLSLWTRSRGAYVYPLPSAGISVNPLALVSSASQMTHGSAGTFSIDLTSGNGIECRSGGANNNYTIVFTFTNPIASVNSVSTSCGTVASASTQPGNDETYVVQLTGVACNAQYVTVGLAGVQDSSNQTLSSASATMGLLIGDVNANGLVDSGDVFLVRQQTGQNATASNFREDVDASGTIDSGDVFLTRQQTGTSLPAAPPQTQTTASSKANALQNKSRVNK